MADGPDCQLFDGYRNLLVDSIDRISIDCTITGGDGFDFSAAADLGNLRIA